MFYPWYDGRIIGAIVAQLVKYSAKMVTTSLVGEAVGREVLGWGGGSYTKSLLKIKEAGVIVVRLFV